MKRLLLRAARIAFVFSTYRYHPFRLVCVFVSSDRSEI